VPSRKQTLPDAGRGEGQTKEQKGYIDPSLTLFNWRIRRKGDSPSIRRREGGGEKGIAHNLLPYLTP